MATMVATVAGTALLQAAVTTVPDWVGPTMAISLAIIALSFLAIAAGLVIAALKVAGQVKRLTGTVMGLQGDVAKTVDNVRRLTEQGQDLLVLVKHEAGAYA